MKNKILIWVLLSTCLFSCTSESMWEEFDDPIFIVHLHDYYDIPLTEKGRIDLSDEATLKALGKITTLYLNRTRISNLSGINNLVSLTHLECEENKLTSLNINGLRKLSELYCRENKIQTLTIRDCNKLHWLICNNNQITSLKIEAVNISVLDCNNNQLKELDIRKFNNLEDIRCGNQSDPNNNAITLSLITSTEQELRWARKWMISPENKNVTVSIK